MFVVSTLGAADSPANRTATSDPRCHGLRQSLLVNRGFVMRNSVPRDHHAGPAGYSLVRDIRNQVVTMRKEVSASAAMAGRAAEMMARVIPTFNGSESRAECVPEGG
jgi:hypothetical protein